MKSFSQNYTKQDLKVIYFFNNEKNLYFVDIGANDGMTISNTFLLEKKYNSPTIFGIKTPSLIKKKFRSDGVLHRTPWRYGWVVNGRYEPGILPSIILRDGRSLKVYRKAQEEERKKQEEERKKREEEWNQRRMYDSDKDDYYTGGMFSRCGTIHPWD